MRRTRFSTRRAIAFARDKVYYLDADETSISFTDPLAAYPRSADESCCNGGIYRPLSLTLPRIPRVPGLAAVGQLPAGRTVELPARGSTYVVDSGPRDAPTYCATCTSVACTGLMTWYPVLKTVGQFGRVVVFDQRLHGQGIACDRFLLEDCADDVAALADVLGIRTFVPVGYSMGSLVAQLVWKRHRERVGWAGAVRGHGGRQPRELRAAGHRNIRGARGGVESAAAEPPRPWRRPLRPNSCAATTDGCSTSSAPPAQAG